MEVEFSALQEHFLGNHVVLSCSTASSTFTAFMSNLDKDSVVIFLLFYSTQTPNSHVHAFYLIHIYWIKKTRSFGTLLARHGEFPQTVSDFSPHALLHILDWIHFQTLHRCFLNEPSVLCFLQGLNYTIQRKKIISFTHSQQCSLSFSCVFLTQLLSRDSDLQLLS